MSIKNFEIIFDFASWCPKPKIFTIQSFQPLKGIVSGADLSPVCACFNDWHHPPVWSSSGSQRPAQAWGPGTILSRLSAHGISSHREGPPRLPRTATPTAAATPQAPLHTAAGRPSQHAHLTTPPPPEARHRPWDKDKNPSGLLIVDQPPRLPVHRAGLCQDEEETSTGHLHKCLTPYTLVTAQLLPIHPSIPTQRLAGFSKPEGRAPCPPVGADARVSRTPSPPAAAL